MWPKSWHAACKSRIEFAPSTARCTSCGRAFGIDAGIPLLVLDGMEVPERSGLGAGRIRIGLGRIERRVAHVSQTHVFKSAALSGSRTTSSPRCRAEDRF